MLDISKIVQCPAPESEYHKVVHPKKQIVIHHTASGGNSLGDIEYLNNQVGKVHTAFFIDRDGKIYQVFSSKYYAAHLGVPTSTFTKFKVNNTVDSLHKQSIAIELDSWGYLTLKGGKYYSYANVEVKAENVVTYPNGFLGQKYYEKYYTPQLEAMKDLLIYLCDTYEISKEYQCDMWTVSANALAGKNGIYTHISYRETGKWDTHPMPELIETLNNLNNK